MRDEIPRATSCTQHISTGGLNGREERRGDWTPSKRRRRSSQSNIHAAASGGGPRGGEQGRGDARSRDDWSGESRETLLGGGSGSGEALGGSKLRRGGNDMVGSKEDTRGGVLGSRTVQKKAELEEGGANPSDAFHATGLGYSPRHSRTTSDGSTASLKRELMGINDAKKFSPSRNSDDRTTRVSPLRSGKEASSRDSPSHRVAADSTRVSPSQHSARKKIPRSYPSRSSEASQGGDNSDSDDDEGWC